MIDEDRKYLALHVKTALTTKSGAVLRELLREYCFMTEPTSADVLESTALVHRINARRDLYIMLENLLQEGIQNVTDSKLSES